MKLIQRNAFYEKLYFQEMTERDRLDDRFRTLLAIVAVVFAILTTLCNVVVMAELSKPLIFWFVFVLAVMSFVAAVVCYIKAWHSQYYQAFPLPIDIEAYISQIDEFYRAQTDEETASQWTDEAFDEFMRTSFIEHASFNARSNDNKRFWLYYGNSFVIGALAFSLMAFVPVADFFL